MYSSLDRADLAVEEDGGRRLAIQTDHRSPAEIDADYDLSVIFGLTRTLNPRRSDQFDAVRFTFMQGLHPGFVAVLQRAGAEIEVFQDGGSQVSEGEPLDDQATDAEAARALAALGQRVLAQHGIRPDEQGLTRLQMLYYAQVAGSEGREEDEITWWSCVVELGAATGEVLKAAFGGAEWRRDEQHMSTVPFVLGRGSSATNVFDKVERFFERGESEAPTALFRILADEGEQGQVMVNLRAAGWGGQEFSWCRPLLEHEGGDIPLIALVHDLPNTTRSVPSDVEDAEALEREALANLAAIEVEIAEVDAAGHAMLATHGDYYASEKLLDPDHLRELHRRHGAELLLAAVPRKGVLFTLSALMSAEASAVMMAVAFGQHADAPPNEKLSTRVFLVQDGRVVGLVDASGPEALQDEADAEIPEAAVDESDPEPPKKGLWAKLFGG